MTQADHFQNHSCGDHIQIQVRRRQKRNSNTDRVRYIKIITIQKIKYTINLEHGVELKLLTLILIVLDINLTNYTLNYITMTSSAFLKPI